MTFLNSGALLWAILFVPIVAMYLVRVQVRRTTVSTNLFWSEVLGQSQMRASLRNLSHWLSLLIQLMIVSLLILALAEPLTAVRRPLRDAVLIIDSSASMSAVHSGTARLQSAKDRVAEYVQSMIPGDRTAILLATTEPRVLCGITDDTEQLQRVLTSLDTPNDAGSEHTIDRSIILAREVLAAGLASETTKGSHTTSIEVFSDLCFPDNAGRVSDTDVTWSVVGISADNAGISRFEARRDPQDVAEYEILIEVTNPADSELHCRLDLDLDDRPIDARRLDLGPNERWSDVVTMRTSPTAGLLSARLMSTESTSTVYVDAMSSDNFRQLQMPARRRLPVTLVTAGNVFLERVLEASQLVELTVVPAGNGLPEYSTLAVNGLLILDAITPAEIPAGNVLAVAPEGPCNLWTTTDPLKQPVVMVEDGSSSLLRNVRLADVQIPTAVGILPTAEHRVLVSSETNAPLITEFPRESGEVVVVAAGLREGDFPLRTAFPIFMANVINRYSSSELTMQPHSDVPASPTAFSTDSDLRPIVDSVRFPLSGSLNSRPASVRNVLIVAALAMALAEWFLFHRRILG